MADHTVLDEPRLLANAGTGRPQNIEYHEYTCRDCGKLAQNTYSEPYRTRLLANRKCFNCDYWSEMECRLERDHAKMTIICGHIYSPGNRTSGSFRGMAGRRFDIEYIEPSAFAGKRTTTFDLWSGSALPDRLKAKFADTARFLGGAEKAQAGETTCWNPSDHKSDPYPLPRAIGLSA